MDTKTCKSCNKSLGVENFDNHSTTRDRLHPDCKSCRSIERKNKDYPRVPDDQIVTCSMCKQDLPAKEFGKDKKACKGIRSSCKECTKLTTSKSLSTFDGFITKLFGDLEDNADYRRIKVFITKQDIYDLYNKQNGKCALTGMDMTHIYNVGNGRNTQLCNMSVDRIDSNLEYTRDNIQLVCAVVNTVKIDMTKEKLIQMCKIITLKKNGKTVQ